MRRFVDLHLCPSIEDRNQAERMIAKSSEMGYHLVGIPLPPNISPAEIRQLRSTCSNAKIDLVTRVDFAPPTPSELLNDLRRFRRKFEVVSVTCLSKPVARQAAKDRRVDILSFPATEPRKSLFNSGEAELASKALASLEIDMTPILSSRGFSRIRLLSRLRREVAIAKKFRVPVIISSGATNESLIRGPLDYAALATLFDMTMPLALRAVSEYPITIVERNREKLSPDYVAEGVRVIRRKHCCLSL
ncbi:MAG: Ribonuclease P protein component 3 [Candidatus Bathyarchaeota archaeon BA1]|nr:MAG: Ribonuclease P protein component 3 [Candidatus Bathyarchaeota archaeon BA1]